MAKKRYVFTGEEERELKEFIDALEHTNGLFYEMHNVKSYESLVDEAAINGVERTLEHYDKYKDNLVRLIK